MQETSKTGRRAMADRPDAAAADARPPGGPLAPSETADSVLRSLLGRIQRDAADDAVTYLSRSNTAHDGE